MSIPESYDKCQMAVFTHPRDVEAASLNAEYTLLDVAEAIRRFPSKFRIREMLPKINKAVSDIRASEPCYVEVDFDPDTMPEKIALLRYLKTLALRLAFSKCFIDYKSFDLLAEMQQTISALLQTPIRNCDVGTPQKQYRRFNAFCDKFEDCEGCPLESLRSPSADDCAILWSQMPYGNKPKTNKQEESK